MKQWNGHSLVSYYRVLEWFVDNSNAVYSGTRLTLSNSHPNKGKLGMGKHRYVEIAAVNNYSLVWIHMNRKFARRTIYLRLIA